MNKDVIYTVLILSAILCITMYLYNIHIKTFIRNEMNVPRCKPRKPTQVVKKFVPQQTEQPTRPPESNDADSYVDPYFDENNVTMNDEH